MFKNRDMVKYMKLYYSGSKLGLVFNHRKIKVENLLFIHYDPFVLKIRVHT